MMIIKLKLKGNVNNLFLHQNDTYFAILYNCALSVEYIQLAKRILKYVLLIKLYSTQNIYKYI